MYLILRYMSWEDMEVSGIPVKVPDYMGKGFCPMVETLEEAEKLSENGKYSFREVTITT